MKYIIPKERLKFLVSEFIDSNFGELKLVEGYDGYLNFVTENEKPVFLTKRGLFYIDNKHYREMIDYFSMDDEILDEILLEYFNENYELPYKLKGVYFYFLNDD